MIGSNGLTVKIRRMAAKTVVNAVMTAAVVTAGGGVVACSGKDSGPTAAQLAAQAAQNYYTQLLRGDYEAFVAGRYQPHAIPDSYREQLVANAKMFIGQQKDDHQGIVKAQAVDAQADTTHHVANVFINLSYGDRTMEEIVVPMVEKKGVWYMR